MVAVFIAGLAGVVAGRSWAAARQRAFRPRGFRTSPHYAQGLHYLTSGQLSLAVSELTKVTREDRDAVEVQQVLSHLLRETGQLERAIQVHNTLLARGDLTRAERAYALASLGADFRKAGFLDRAARAFDEALELEPNNIYALMGEQKLYEDQRQWREAYRVQTRLARLRKTEDTLVLGYLQAQMGEEALQAGDKAGAESAFRTALGLDRRVFPAHIGLADLRMPDEPAQAAAILEEAIKIAPERAYLAFDRLERAFAALGEPLRFASLCERVIRQDPRDWRARVALARHLRAGGKEQEAYGLLLRAVEANPQVLLVHLEMLRTLRAMGPVTEAQNQYIVVAESSVFYADPHICTACRYRAESMLWRCPHCHEWNTFVEERVGPVAAGR